MEIEQFGRYNAVVSYHRTDDLKPNTPENKQKVIVEACWIADDGENFEGDWIVYLNTKKRTRNVRVLRCGNFTDYH